MDKKMDSKNIVSIEDRIPKLKQARKKKANRRMISYICIFFCLISIIVYLQSPLSKIKKMAVTGNTYLTDQEIIHQSKLTMDTNIWSVNKKETIQKLEKNPIIESAEIKRKLPWTIQIKVTEQPMVGFIENKGKYIPVLENGSVLYNRAQKNNDGNAPVLSGFNDKTFLKQMTAQLQKLPDRISGMISEIHWVPTKKDKSKILLYMNDGNLVSGRISRFSDDIRIYPSITAQLDPGKKGIVHIGVGAYFEAFKTKKK